VVSLAVFYGDATPQVEDGDLRQRPRFLPNRTRVLRHTLHLSSDLKTEDKE
jgi:hypothetical protein